MQWSNPPIVLSILEKFCSNLIRQTYPSLAAEVLKQTLEVTPSKGDKFGHYQCNSAMKLSKFVGESPRAIAAKLLSHPIDPIIESTEIAGPGFININLKTPFIEELLNDFAKDPRLGIPPIKKPKRVVIDFSSPNTAKELHAGHLRSTIIGDSLSSLFEFIGHDVLRLNHVGNWGTPFGMLICYLKKFHPNIVSGKKKTDLSNLAHWYKESRKVFDSDDNFKKESQREVVDLQAGKKSALDVWEIICEISRQGYGEIYKLLDIRIQERGESYYNYLLPTIVQYFEERGLITLSDGAKCIFMPDFVAQNGEPLPLIIEKSDGGYNYATTDLATLYQRITEEHADRILYVVDGGQSLHFQMFFKAAQLAGYYDPNKVEVSHVPFGLVLGADGTKFKTRAGDSEKLIDLLKKAITKAHEILIERTPDLPEKEKKETAEVLGINAVKYADLSSLRTKDYQFSYDKMLQFEGNTAAFLMYAYVRIKSIQIKSAVDLNTLKQGKISLKEPSELQMAIHLVQFGETITSMADSLLPNRLTDYLYQLANHFHAFFRDCIVIGSKEESSRLLLIEIVKRTFEIGFSILGLKTVSKM